MVYPMVLTLFTSLISIGLNFKTIYHFPGKAIQSIRYSSQYNSSVQHPFRRGRDTQDPSLANGFGSAAAVAEKGSAGITGPSITALAAKDLNKGKPEEA